MIMIGSAWIHGMRLAKPLALLALLALEALDVVEAK
jgi:hypothetical protein